MRAAGGGVPHRVRDCGSLVFEERRLHCQIAPAGIHLGDQRVLPRARPALQFPFPCNGLAQRVVRFEIDELPDPVFRGMDAALAAAVLSGALLQVAGDADVDRRVGIAGQDVGVKGHAR